MLELAGPLAVAALVLAAGGLFKLRDPVPTRDMFAALGVGHRGLRLALALASGLVELALGVATFLVGGWVLAFATAAAFAIFALLALRLMHAASAASCGCFGRHSGSTTGLHVAIDAAVAAVALTAGVADAPGFLDARNELPTGGVVFVGLAVLGAWLVIAALTALPETLEAARRTPARGDGPKLRHSEPAVKTAEGIESLTTTKSAPTTRIVDKLSGLLARRTGRRGFLARSAVVGSAIAANPLTYALEPKTAYAAICNCSGSACDCGQLCCDGYTEFCCALSGENKCPPGTILGGWWKVDGSGFCGGGPRYYMDCNATCGGCGCGGSGLCSGACSGTGCGCAFGDCNNRKAGCTLFRYGQCNQHIGCLGPIVCRVVTCVPPWALDGTCTTTVRVDGATAGHDRSCLHKVIGGFDAAEESSGGARLSGWALDFDTQAPIDIAVFVDGGYAGSRLANAYRPDVGVAYQGWGDHHGFDVTIPVGGGAVKQLCVWGISTVAGSENTLLGCRTVRFSTPFGSFDGITAGAGTIRLTGWAIDPDTSAALDVHAYVDNVFRGEFTANAFRPDVGSAYGASNFHGIDITLPVSGGTHRVCLYAMNAGAGSVNQLLGCRNVDVGRPFGSLDKVVSAGGGLLVQGWAIDPDTNDPIVVHAYVDNAYKGEFTANVPRPDVAAAHLGYGANHGFDFTVATTPGQHNLCLYAIDSAQGHNPVIGCRTATSLSGDPFGALDSVVPGPANVRMGGWVIDPDASGPIKVHVYIDNTFKGEFDANVARPDVASAYPGYGQPHGFDITVPTFIGFQQVSVFSIDVGPGGNKLVGSKMVVVGGNPYGAVDTAVGQAGGVRVAGWAIDPDTAAAAKVHVYVDSVYRGEFNANQSRPDVGGAFPAYGGDHGFNATVPTSSGSHQVCVYVINLGWGGNQLLACRNVNVP